MRTVSLLFCAGLLAGCAGGMGQGPDLSTIDAGTSRDAVIAQFGQPASTEQRNGGTVDTYRVMTTTAQAGPAHVVVMTTGPGVVAVPVVNPPHGTAKTITVQYDANGQVTSVGP